MSFHTDSLKQTRAFQVFGGKIPQPIQTSLWPANCTQKLAQPRDTRWTVHLARFTAHNRPFLFEVSQPVLVEWKFREEFASSSLFFLYLQVAAQEENELPSTFRTHFHFEGKFFSFGFDFCKIFYIEPVCGPNCVLYLELHLVSR